MLIGGLAVVARGVARTTRDVDATLPGDAVALPDLLASLAAVGIVPRVQDAAAFARRTQVLLLRHAGTGIDVDLTLAFAPFELEAIARADEVSIGRTRMRIARPEDLVVYKVVGGRPIDLADIDELLVLHAAAMDLQRVRLLAAEVAEALDDPARLASLDAALARAGAEGA